MTTGTLRGPIVLDKIDHVYTQPPLNSYLGGHATFWRLRCTACGHTGDNHRVIHDARSSAVECQHDPGPDAPGMVQALKKSIVGVNATLPTDGSAGDRARVTLVRYVDPKGKCGCVVQTLPGAVVDHACPERGYEFRYLHEEK